MNFDADRLSRLSGLSPTVNTGVIIESAEHEDAEAVAEGATDELTTDDAPLFELTDDSGEDADMGIDEGEEATDDSAHTELTFESERDRIARELNQPDFESANHIVQAMVMQQMRQLGMANEDGDSSFTADVAMRNLRDAWARQLTANKADDYDDATHVIRAMVDWAVNSGETPDGHSLRESAPLTMETLRETVLELRDEILAENEAEQQALAEAPARAAIRKEIKALLAEMPTDAAANWMYGSKGKPSQNGEKSRATTLLGIGFENSKN